MSSKQPPFKILPHTLLFFLPPLRIYTTSSTSPLYRDSTYIHKRHLYYLSAIFPKITPIHTIYTHYTYVLTLSTKNNNTKFVRLHIIYTRPSTTFSKKTMLIQTKTTSHTHTIHTYVPAFPTKKNTTKFLHTRFIY